MNSSNNHIVKVHNSRREALKKTALLMGAALSAPVIASVMSGCERQVGRNWTPEYLNAEQADLVTAISETMFPKTETPGAIEAGIGSFMDITLKNNTDKDHQVLFAAGLASLDQKAADEYGKGFIQLSDEDRLSFLEKLDKEQYDLRQSKPRMKFNERPFFWNFKELAMSGYFSSEAVAKNYFVYDAIPGEYEGCIEFDTVGAAWADL